MGIEEPPRQTTIWQQTRGLGLAISLTLALFVALTLPVATFAAGSNTVAVVRSSGADLYDVPDGAAIQSLVRGSALEAIGTHSRWRVVEGDDSRRGDRMDARQLG